MRTPISTWEEYIGDEPFISEAAWKAVLDNRFICEVQRTEPYRGVLCIFDHENNNKLLKEINVTISYDALYGPDVFDVEDWSNLCMDFIDSSGADSQN